MTQEEEWTKARENFNKCFDILNIPHLQMAGDDPLDRMQLTNLNEYQVRIYTESHFCDVDTMFFATSTPEKIAEYIALKIKEVSNTY
jgi:hypothetical protein